MCPYCEIGSSKHGPQMVAAPSLIRTSHLASTVRFGLLVAHHWHWRFMRPSFVEVVAI